MNGVDLRGPNGVGIRPVSAPSAISGYVALAVPEDAGRPLASTMIKSNATLLARVRASCLLDGGVAVDVARSSSVRHWVAQAMPLREHILAVDDEQTISG